MSANFSVARFAVVATVGDERTTVNGPFGQQAAEQFCVAAVATGKLLDFKIVPWDELDANLATRPAADPLRSLRAERDRLVHRAGLPNWNCVSLVPEIWVRRDGAVCHIQPSSCATKDALAAFDRQYPVVSYAPAESRCGVDSK